MRPHTWSRPKSLLNVAGDTIIGHQLNLMREVTGDEVIFVVGRDGDELEAWIREHHSYLNARFVLQDEPLGQAHAVWMCRDFMNDEALLVAFGDGIVDADYPEISDTDADAVCMVQEVDDPRTFGVAVVGDDGFITDFIEKPMAMDQKMALAGIYWFRQGRLLRQSLDIVIKEERKTRGEYYLVDAFHVLMENGARVAAKPTVFWFDAGKPDNILTANARLLSIGYGSQDALERSYAGDFTVLPPVFIHDAAEITTSVIGPYVNIEEGVTIRNSVIRNSIIDEGSTIENCILDGALIGQHCRVTGQRKALFVGDNSRAEIS